MKKNRFLTFAITGALILSACGSASPRPEATDLESAEIREYEGQDLSSVEDFRENSIAGPQQVSMETYRLEIGGEVETPLSLTYEEVLAYDAYRKAVTLYCVEGWDATILWEGVLIEDLLADAGVKPGAVTVIFHAVDGYTSSLSLDDVRENDILLAYKMNDVTMPPERGFPFAVVAESKWGYKWVKWVDQITLSTDPDYRGFWEQRGYNNEGDTSGPIFE